MTPARPPGLHPLAWVYLQAEADRSLSLVAGNAERATLDAAVAAFLTWERAGCPLVEVEPAKADEEDGA